MSEQRPQLHERLLPRTGLDKEWMGYRLALRHNDISHLLNAGLHVEDIYHRGMVGIARVLTQDDSRWRPSEDERWGASMYVTPVRVDYRSEYPYVEQPKPQRAAYRGQLIDIAAWVPGGPVHRRTGDAVMLGSSQYRPHGEEEPLRVHRHPINWLRSGGQGIVMLTPDPAIQREILMGHRHILAENQEHREHLQQVVGRFAQIHLPRQHIHQDQVQRQELRQRQEQVWGR